jgi:hypothetical protein
MYPKADTEMNTEPNETVEVEVWGGYTKTHPG